LPEATGSQIKSDNPKATVFRKVLLISAVMASTGTAQEHKVDFGFAPTQYATAICFPDDWQKSLVTENGSLAYDYGPGPYAKPLTEISVGVKGQELHITRQGLDNPIAPIVTTELKADGISAKLEAFAIIPESFEQLGNLVEGRVRRIGGLNGCIGWATPIVTADPAFRNVAWGTNRPIKYRVKVEPGSKKRVAMGVCESYKPRAGLRLLELRVEGASPLTVDPMVDGKKNQPYVFLFDAQDVNNDGWLEIEAHASPRSPDPNVILNAFWVFPPNSRVTADAILRGEVSSKAEVYFDCGTELENVPSNPRLDAILATFRGDDMIPVVIVKSRRALAFDSTEGILETDGRPYLLSRPKPLAAAFHGDKWVLELPRGTRTLELLVVNGRRGSDSVRVVPSLIEELARARDYWLKNAPIPKSVIVVPDSGIQYLLDANIRNLYQVREVVDGAVQFQPGPTVYRGLWLPDAMLTGLPVMMLGDTSAARSFFEGAMHFQLPRGQFRVMYPTVSLIETSTFVFSVCYYSMATGDRAWLQRYWPIVRRGLDWARSARKTTLLGPPVPYFGLMPPGFVDGGVANEHADYGSVWWAMIALEKAMEAARWLGHFHEAEEWQVLFDDFMDSFRFAARRDMTKDGHGNLFLPMIVGDTSASVPQRGQYDFLLPLEYAKFFHQKDPLLDSIVNGNLGMLDATLKEGLIANSGWLDGGVWPWLGAAHGIAHNLVGNKSKATDLLYAVVNHASPVGTWVEEQQTRDAGPATAGDVSNAEASAVFVHFVRNLIARERGENLEMLTGVPPEWLVPGARIEVDSGFTEFGPLTLRLKISTDRKSADLFVSVPDGRGSAGRPIVFLQTLKEVGYVFDNGSPLPDVLDGSWGGELRMQFKKQM
jgi:hypothetical protein